MSETQTSKGFLKWVEKAGNNIPHPVFIFLFFIICTLIASFCMEGLTIKNPGTGENLTVVNALSADGLRWFLKNIAKNFTNFPPLGAVLCCMIGIGVCDESGLMKSIIVRSMGKASPRMATIIILFVGICGNLASSPVFVIIPPLGAMIFRALGRHPLAGAACGFAGVAAGLSANVLVTSTDILLLSLTQKAAQIIDPNIQINPASNWYFMFVSTFVLVIAGTFACEKIVEPRLGKWTPEMSDNPESLGELSINTTSLDESRGLRWAGLATLFFLLLLLIAVVPSNGILRNQTTGSIVQSPFMSGILALLTIYFLLIGVCYGYGAKKITKARDAVDMMTKSMSALASFIVLCFFAAQFCYLFSYTNIGLWIAVKGSEWLLAVGLKGIPLVLLFILFCTLVNFLIGSASAKWALLAPISVPMFMSIGWSPYYTTAIYRIADSVTNSISPMEPFMPYMLSLFQQYDRKAGFGTLISVMLPFAFFFMLAWILLLIGWTLLGLPLGPGANLFLSM